MKRKRPPALPRFSPMLRAALVAVNTSQQQLAAKDGANAAARGSPGWRYMLPTADTVH